MSEKKKTLVSLITAAVSFVFSSLISFFLSKYLVKELGEEANGFAQLANNFVTVASLVSISLNSMAGRFVTVSYHSGKKNDSCKYYSSVLIGNVVIVVVLFVPALFCVLKLNDMINIDTANVLHVKILFACVFLNFFVTQFVSVLSIAFFVKNTQYLQNVLNMLFKILYAVGLMFVFSVLPARLYYVSLVGLFMTLLLIPCYLYFKKKLVLDVGFSLKSFDIGYIKTMLISGFWNTLTQCGNILMNEFDLLISDLFVGPGKMGVLAIAKTVPTFISGLGVSVNSSFAPNLTISFAGYDKNNAA